MSEIAGEIDLDDVQVDPRAWPDFADGTGRPTREGARLGPSVFAVFLVPDMVDALHLGRPAATVIPLAVAYGLSYLAVWWLVWRWPPHWRLIWVGWLYAVGVACIIAAGPAESAAALGYALSATIVLLPMSMARWIGIATVGGALVAGVIATHRVDWPALLILLLVLISIRTLVRMNRTVEKLRVARSEIRTLAVANERARLARDLHDVLGHSLTTITVKTALARRLVESGADSERVRAELRDTEELSRRALADIRATVSGQRRMSLAAELVAARSALRAAGIEADLPNAVDDVQGRLEEPLAYVLREGVTNVVRHSGARRCTVRLGARWLEVLNDGPADPAAARPVGGFGNGLTGLRERLTAVHGTIEAEARPGGGFRLRAEVPE
jgi:two-component system sensor histidine kinase DesK